MLVVVERVENHNSKIVHPSRQKANNNLLQDIKADFSIV